MDSKSENSSAILSKLDASIKKTYHLYIAVFLSLNGMPPDEQDALAEQFVEEITLGSMATQDIARSLMSSCALAAALIGTKRAKPIAEKCNDLLNVGCPCNDCQSSGQPISLKITKSLVKVDIKTDTSAEQSNTSLKSVASKLDKKLN